MELFTRNNPEKHPMLQQLLYSDDMNIKINKILWFFYSVKLEDSNDVIVFDDPISVIIGYFKYKFTNRKKIYWMLELYEHQIKINSIYRFFRYLFFSGLGYVAIAIADAIFVSSKLRYKYVSMKYSMFLRGKIIKVIYNIPNSVKAENLNLELIERIKKFANEKYALAIYAGSIQDGRDVGDFIKCFSSQSDFGLILCGPVKNENIRDQILNAKSILYLGNLSQKEVLKVYEYCQIGLLSYDNDPMNVKLCAPVKIWEYLQANLKIVGNKNHALVNEWRCYISNFYDEHNNVCNAVALAHNDSLRINMGTKIFDMAAFGVN